MCEQCGQPTRTGLFCTVCGKPLCKTCLESGGDMCDECRAAYDNHCAVTNARLAVEKVFKIVEREYQDRQALFNKRG